MGDQVELSNNNCVCMSESQVKNGSHQLLMGTEARKLDETIWIEFCI